MSNSTTQSSNNISRQREVNWLFKYKHVWTFVQMHRRYPSRHHPEEHVLLNWMKYNRKLINRGMLSEERVKLLKKLDELRRSFDEF
ncbi:MAG: hypothetical protein ACI3YD_00720 [Alloprevotella sp.]